MTAKSRRTTWIAVALLLLLGLGLWWFRGGEEDSAGDSDVAADESRSAAKRSIDARAGGEERGLRKRWQERGASVAGTVREKGGGPLVGADVCAWIGDDAAPSSMLREPLCTTSRADGTYRLTDLPPLRMSVFASAPQHIPGSYEASPGDIGFQLQRGEAKTGVDIELATGGVQIHGVVKDVAGGVIEGALVANSFWRWNSSSRGRGRAKTDEQGEFTLWVAPGELQISAEAEGYAPGASDGAAPGYSFEILLTPESVLAGVVVRAGTGTPVAGVRVDAGNDWDDGSGGTAYTDDNGRFRIDRLSPGRYKPAARAEDGYGRAAQSVHLGLGESAEDVRVELHAAITVRARILSGGDPQRPCEHGGASINDEITGASHWSEANADGTVEFSAVLPGKYDVNVWCRASVPQEKYEPVVVGTDPLPELVWSVNDGLAIAGIVVGPKGEPIAGASLFAQAKSAAPRGQVGGAWGVRTGDDGRFRMEGLLPGRYGVRMTVDHPDVVGPSEPIDVEVESGDTPELRIELEAAGKVEGRVVDQNGKPVVHASVRLRGDEHGWGGSASSRDDGTFSITGVRPESYRATAAQGWNDEMRTPGKKDDDVHGERVVVVAGETAKVELVVEDRSGTIRGRVVDESGGPVDDAFVHATRESDSASKSAGSTRERARWGSWSQKPVLTDQEGEFELADVEPGKHTIFATRKGGGEGTLEHVEVGSTGVVVHIATGASISGTVAIAGGGAPTKFVISASERAQGFARTEEFFETGGAWSLDELPPGSYELAVEATEGRDTESLKLADAEQKTGVAFELQPKVDVEGTVVDLETGEPIANVAVTISPRQVGSMFMVGGGGSEKENVSDAAGKFTVRGAATGKVQVMLLPRARGDETYRWTSLGATIPSDVQSYTLPPLAMPKSRLKRGKRPGDLGFKIKETPPELDGEEFPITIAFIRPDGPAAATELTVGDVVTGVDGHDVSGDNRRRYDTLTRVAQGTKVTLDLQSGKSVEIVAGKPP
ncbi:MAG TPA: carboxypeptidase regulatory-like domain-containing protein [Nannocystaceae bacterium]|nr:carboxypeptidase regulatory-like domain-containing protein [Nannocystaceae bacterium]